MLLRHISLGKKGQADQGLLWDHHFDGHAIAAIVRTRKCLYHRVLVSGENPANRCDPEAPFWEVAESVMSLLTSN